MALIGRGSVPTATRKKEAVEVPELGGEVAIRQMTLTQYLDAVRYGAMHDGMAPVARILAECVLVENDEPLWGEEQWEAWGAQHMEASLRLYERVRNLTAETIEAAAKN